MDYWVYVVEGVCGREARRTMTEEDTGVSVGWLDIKQAKKKLRLLVPRSQRSKVILVVLVWFIVFTTNNLWLFLVLMGGFVSWIYLTME